jgi:thioesterase domain-containing protein
MSEQALKTSAEKRIADLPSMSALAADHVALILRHKTKRPIVLAGHCFSGLLACEVAHQLSQAGKPVEMVMMLDTWMTRSIPWWWRKKTWLQAHWQKFRQQGPGYFWRKSRRRINLEKDELAARLKLMTDRDFSVHVPWTIIQRIYRQASRGYRPPTVLSSRGVLFISGNDWQSNAYRKIDNSLGADRWFAEPAVVVDVPGDHVTVLDEQNLPELARCYDKTLAKLLAK